MTPYKKRMNKYIRRMAEDMQVRNFADATIDAYTYHADNFCQHFGKTADQLGPEEIREYQLFLVNEKKASWSTFCLLYTSPSPRDQRGSRMPSSA